MSRRLVPKYIPNRMGITLYSTDGANEERRAQETERLKVEGKKEERRREERMKDNLDGTRDPT